MFTMMCLAWRTTLSNQRHMLPFMCVCLRARTCVYVRVCVSVCACAYSSCKRTWSRLRSFACLFACLFVRSFVCSLVRSLVHSFVRSVVCCLHDSPCAAEPPSRTCVHNTRMHAHRHIDTQTQRYIQRQKRLCNYHKNWN